MTTRSSQCAPLINIALIASALTFVLGCSTLVKRDYYPDDANKGYVLITGRLDISEPKWTLRTNLDQDVEGKRKFIGSMLTAKGFSGPFSTLGCNDFLVSARQGTSTFFIQGGPEGRHSFQVPVYNSMTTRVTVVFSNLRPAGSAITGYLLSYEIDDPTKTDD